MDNLQQVYKGTAHRLQAAIARIKRLRGNAYHTRAATGLPGIRSYVYKPLPTSDSFRLIELLPGMPDSPLRCNLILTRRKGGAVGYQALSYTWGEAIFPQCLEEISTQAVIRITDNLYGALQTLRFEERSRLLWVDAICIAQDNIKEKSHQVRRMALIYREAISVIVWMGKDDQSGVFDQLACISRSPSHPRDCKYEDDTIRYIAYTNDPHYVLYRYCRLQDVEDFLAQPWFHRVWVVQEFVLAKRLCLHVGPTCIVDQSFFRAFAFCMLSEERLTGMWLMQHPNMNRTMKLVAFREFHRMHDGNTTDWTTEGRIHMARCLDLLEWRQCSDDRDRFYSLLGLLTINMGIVPNYAAEGERWQAREWGGEGGEVSRSRVVHTSLMKHDSRGL